MEMKKLLESFNHAEELPRLLVKEKFQLEIQRSISNLVRKINNKLIGYGQKNNIKLGTTMSTLVIIENIYMVFHIGDSRIYKLKEKNLIQITEDQTFIARELAMGNITKQEAEVHPKRNVLLECIGVKNKANLVVNKGIVEENDVFIICSDGFYHKVSSNEIINSFSSSYIKNKYYIKSEIINLVQLIKKRQERDNISIITVKIT